MRFENEQYDCLQFTFRTNQIAIMFTIDLTASK